LTFAVLAVFFCFLRARPDESSSLSEDVSEEEVEGAGVCVASLPSLLSAAAARFFPAAAEPLTLLCFAARRLGFVSSSSLLLLLLLLSEPSSPCEEISKVQLTSSHCTVAKTDTSWH
jgi:hypothetical protein